MILKTILRFTILSMIYEFKNVESGRNEEASSSTCIGNEEASASTHEYMSNEDQSEEYPPTAEENDIVCDICKSTDHTTNNCTIENRPCFICHSRGHLYVNCPNKRDIKQEELDAKKKEISEINKHLSQTEIHGLEEKTKKQDECEEWHQYRKFRLSTSIFERVFLLLKNPNNQSEYIETGILHIIFSIRRQKRTEANKSNIVAAIKALEKEKDVEVQPAGLFIDEIYQYFCGTPDGIIEKKNAIVKIIFSSKRNNEHINEKENETHLGITSYYQYHIQGLLHFTKRKLCYLVVWTEKVIHEIHEILRNDDFWKNDMESQLVNFYKNHYLNAIAIQDLYPKSSTDKKKNPKFKHIRCHYCKFIGHGYRQCTKKRVFSKPELEEEKGKILRNLAITSNEISDLQDTTKDQNEAWSLVRKNRLATSELGRICKSKDISQTNTIISDIIHNRMRKPTVNERMKTAKDNAIKEFQLSGKGSVIPAGLFVDENIQYLCGTIDGLIGTEAIVKVLYSEQPMDQGMAQVAQTVNDTERHKRQIIIPKEENGQINLRLNTRDDHYYQVQGLLQMSKRNLCYFLFSTEKGISVDEIKRDEEFWIKYIQGQLKTFYESYLEKLAEHNLNMAYVNIPANPQVSP